MGRCAPAAPCADCSVLRAAAHARTAPTGRGDAAHHAAGRGCTGPNGIGPRATPVDGRGTPPSPPPAPNPLPTLTTPPAPVTGPASPGLLTPPVPLATPTPPTPLTSPDPVAASAASAIPSGRARPRTTAGIAGTRSAVPGGVGKAVSCTPIHTGEGSGVRDVGIDPSGSPEAVLCPTEPLLDWPLVEADMAPRAACRRIRNASARTFAALAPMLHLAAVGLLNPSVVAGPDHPGGPQKVCCTEWAESRRWG